MKNLLFGILFLWSFTGKAQVFNNEWINYSKTYYKFKLAKTGVWRIPQSILGSAGLGNTPAEQFQLWRNGAQVPIYTSVPSGALPDTGYIEFWGQMNDGKPDRELYRLPSYQLSTRWSLETDTATYFLTVNADAAVNLRLKQTVNNVPGNTLPAEPYFMYTAGNYFKNRLNSGYAVYVGENLYSSSYDIGEGWSSPELVSTVNSDSITYGKLSFVFNNLFVYNGGPDPRIRITASGNAINPRRFKVQINRDSVLGATMDFYDDAVDSANISLGILHSTADTVTVTNISNITCEPPPIGCGVDRMVIHDFELTYPRQFNFGGTGNFEFRLPPSLVGNYLEIANFSFGSSTPVLYDLTNGKRYEADLSGSPLLKFALEPSGRYRDLVLVSEQGSNINSVSTLVVRNFIDYRAEANQGDYLIISSPVLFAGSNGSNPVEDYRAYRSSASGGRFNARIYLADQLIDQFGFGISSNPSGLRNFIRYARLNYTVRPKFVFIIGRGVHYVDHRNAESGADMSKLNLVPAFGFPASDILLTAEPGSSIPEIPIGRLSAITPGEVSVYLKKMMEYEAAQALMAPDIRTKGWMKNIVHIIGTSTQDLDEQLNGVMSKYKSIIEDTAFGGHVETFSKQTVQSVEQVSSGRLSDLFTEGISMITYFGHSSATTLEFNLDNPKNYNNVGKYPLFLGLGCNAGNFFTYNSARIQTPATLSEKYILEPDKGTIGFIASTHFGIVHYLDIWATEAYKEMASKSYGKSMGEIMKATAQDVFNLKGDDFYARCNVEESELHGDPAFRLNTQPKPDYVIEDPMVKVTPGFVSVADASFKVSVAIKNIGKAIHKDLIVEVKRQLPDGNVVVVQRSTIPGVKYMDSISVVVPIIPTKEKGLNRIIVTVDPEDSVAEMFESNNSVTKDVMIYEDGARPVYPYNYAIVNQQNISLIASTANPFSPAKEYKMELDTTQLFNSPFKITRSVTSAGGTMKFDPGVQFTDGTVYYWRVAPAGTGDIAWNSSSFTYLNGSEAGFNQSHYYQHLNSVGDHISLKDSRTWGYDSVMNNLFVKNGVFGSATNQEGDIIVSVNNDPYIRSACVGFSLIFNLFDPVTFRPQLNLSGKYGSALPCAPSRSWNFEYSYMSSSSRKLAMDFMDSIPVGTYVVVRNILNAGQTNNFAIDWASDTSLYGPNNSLYHKLKDAGMAILDSFNAPRAFAFIYQKGVSGFTPVYAISNGRFDVMTLSADMEVPAYMGTITSPVLGPAKKWSRMNWGGTSMDAGSGDIARIDIIGIQKNGSTVDTIIRNLDLTQQTFDISSISAAQYPYLQLHMQNIDSVNNTPYQLGYWRLTGVPAAEGAIDPKAFFSMSKDTFDVAEPFDFQIAFKNVSPDSFEDSLKVKLIVTDRNNVTHELPVVRHKPLNAGDTVHIRYPIDTRYLVGSNFLFVDVNPDNDQPEQYHFNNFAYREFYVRGDSLHPLLDVTFDNVHIINNDIVSSKPLIAIKLKDEAKWFLLEDQSGLIVNLHKLTKEDAGWSRDFQVDGDTLQFFGAHQDPAHTNTATALFKPVLKDGKYELTVTGRDMSGNKAGNMEYKVSFEVFNKPMISNMLNYPNPFTTSTAFVFTLTGSVLPQNLKIQILTVTGKVVREITKEELGPLHIGRNITEFKWDGTDQYGQKLANGVYLYRVVTNLNGNSLEKYKSENDDTDKFFNKGYGKMYLMR